MTLGSLGVRRVDPFDLMQAPQGAAQVGQVQLPVRVVVRKMPDLRPVGCRLHGREGGVRELADILP